MKWLQISIRVLLAKAIRRMSVAIFVAAALVSGATDEQASDAGPTRDLKLKDFLQRVLERNESVQIRALELSINHKRYKAEQGIFEPELVLGYDYVENNRENTIEQRRSTGSLEFHEKNNLYDTGLEGLIPTGAKIRLGYTLRDLRNNLQDQGPGVIYTQKPGSEYQSFAGISLTQPLFKNAWNSATMANIRLAALGEDVAYQEYRRQLMLVITTAEAAYWNLFLAQEQVRFFRDSAQLAEGLVRDSRARLEAGRGSELEVLEATAGLALRKTKLAEAQQRYFETVAQMATLASEAAEESAPRLRATDSPGRQSNLPAFSESGKAAFEMNPDYLGQIKRLQQEDVRVAYVKNQRFPQLDLKASYGLNGLGDTPHSSYEDVVHGGYPSYTAGVELRVPLVGGIRGRNELDAALLRRKQLLVSLKEIENQILNTVTSALQKIRSTEGSVRDYQQILAFNQNLLDTELKRQEIGKVDIQRVLDVEAAVFEAKNSVVEAQVKNERARLELELVQGTVLQTRVLEISKDDLGLRTIRRLKELGVPEQQYRGLLKVQRKSEPGASASSQDAAIQKPATTSNQTN